MQFVIDTNALSGHFNNSESIVKQVIRAERIIVPAIVVGELLGGYRHGSRFTQNEHVLQAFLESSIISVTPVDEKIAAIYGELYAYLRKNGTPIPTNDIWIAAVAVAAGLPLLTLDSDFDHLPQVRRIYT